MPTYEQAEAAQEEQPYLVAHGIEVSSPERWIGGSVCYAEGWALGRLVFVEPKVNQNFRNFFVDEFSDFLATFQKSADFS